MSLVAIRERNAARQFLGRRALIVGGTGGIGRGIAMVLAKANVSVTIAGRSEEAGKEVVSELTKASPDTAVVHNFRRCDASTMAGVKQCALEYAAAEGRDGVDYLVFTQCIATTNAAPTADGVDIKLSLHWLSRVHFAQLLMPLMQGRHDARVLSVLSAGVHSALGGWEKDPLLQQSYSLSNAANAVGTFNDVAWDSMAKQHTAVTFTHTAPGFVASNWGTDLHWAMRTPLRALQSCFGRTIWDSAEYMSEGIWNESLKGGFRLLDQYGKEGPKVVPEHTKLRERTWAWTQKLLSAIIKGEAVPTTVE